jgi:hypothetical protein
MAIECPITIFFLLLHPFFPVFSSYAPSCGRFSSVYLPQIHGALFILCPWLPDVPLHQLDFGFVNLWVQIRGVPLEYFTQDMAVRMGSVIGFVTSVDRDTVSQENLEYMCFCVIFHYFEPLIPSVFLRLQNGEVTWINFGYECIFKLCFKCGCIGHLEHCCPYSYEMT